MENNLKPVAQFETVIDDVKNLLTEGEFAARWDLLTTYHHAGSIIAEKLKDIPINQTAMALGKSERLVYQMIQFYKKFPSLDDLPKGKAISWTQVVKKYLPAHKDKKDIPLEARIKQFIEDMFPADRRKEFIKEVVIDWMAWKKQGTQNAKG